MNKAALELQNALNFNLDSPPKSKHKVSRCSLYSPKLSVYLLAIFVALLVLFQILSLQSESSFRQQWQRNALNSSLSTFHDCGQALNSYASKLSDSVTFIPLKDLRFASSAMRGHTWFMSSMYDIQEEGQVQYQQFPTQAPKGKVLCLKGHDTHDGSWNSYALAWPETLPHNVTLMKGITFVSYNHYDYNNIWHGLSAMMPFVAWHIKNQCAVPKRWILYHWGELRTNMAPWVRTLLEATFGEPLSIENFDGILRNELDGDDTPACFEEAVVMRHNEGGMSREKRMEVYDLMRCKSRMYCNVSSEDRFNIGMTMLMRNGARSFKNSSAVISIFEKECREVEGCRLMVAYPHNLTFCEQVKLMSLTDIVISAHGAQLSNMILMDRNSSVMEFFPKGWLELAGVGQFVHHWLANWAGMKHQGTWRDPVGDHCPYPENDRRCMSVFKNGRIGHNETRFSEWAKSVLKEVKIRKTQEASIKFTNPISNLCGCS